MAWGCSLRLASFGPKRCWCDADDEGEVIDESGVSYASVDDRDSRVGDGEKEAMLTDERVEKEDRNGARRIIVESDEACDNVTWGFSHSALTRRRASERT